MYAAADALGTMDYDQKKLYHTRSVAVTLAPVRAPTQRPLVLSFTKARPITLHLALAFIKCVLISMIHKNIHV